MSPCQVLFISACRYRSRPECYSIHVPVHYCQSYIIPTPVLQYSNTSITALNPSATAFIHRCYRTHTLTLQHPCLSVTVYYTPVLQRITPQCYTICAPYIVTALTLQCYSIHTQVLQHSHHIITALLPQSYSISHHNGTAFMYQCYNTHILVLQHQHPSVTAFTAHYYSIPAPVLCHSYHLITAFMTRYYSISWAFAAISPVHHSSGITQPVLQNFRHPCYSIHAPE